jgi:hypothetical protein
MLICGPNGLPRWYLSATCTRPVDPAASMIVVATPVVPSPLKFCWKSVSADCSAWLAPDSTAPLVT